MTTNSKENVRRTLRGLAASGVLFGAASFGGCGAQSEDSLPRETQLGSTSQAFIYGGLRPTLLCVDDLGDDNFRAHFGYSNPGGAVEVRVGLLNRFVPRPRFQGQPTSFGAGDQEDVFTVDFAVGDGWNRLAWWLNARRALATAHSPRCAPVPECTVVGDCPDDLNECTAESCDAGVCVVDPEPLGAPCGPGLTCDGTGGCG